MRLKSKAVQLWGPVLVLVPFVLALAVAGVYAKGGEDGWLGVYIQNIDEDLKESEDLPSTDGVFVTGVVDDSPADKAGIKRGDVILRFDGRAAKSVRRLTRMIEWSDPGEEKSLVIYRDGSEKNITVTLGEEEDFDLAFLEDEDFDVDVPDVPSPPRAYTFSLGQISTSRIGVSLYELSDQLAEHFGAEDGGALINEVEKDGPADRAGLQAGDVIVKIDHKPVEDIDDIRDAIQEKEEGETVTVTVLRPTENAEKTVDVEVEESATWSGIGDHRLFTRPPHRIRLPRFDTREWRSTRREQRRALREARDEWREELEEQMEELRQELKELKRALKENGL